MAGYRGYERRTSEGWQLTKTIDAGTLLTAIGLLIALLALTTKLENRITAVETKIQMMLDGRLR